MRGAVAHGREATCRRGRDEREASHALRAPQCKVEGDGAPQGVADKVEGRQIERIDESADIGRQPRDRVASGPRLRLPTAAQVHRIRPEASGEAIEDALPPARGSEIAVHEDEHVTAGAGFLVVDAQILQIDEGHLGRISSHRWASPFIDVRHAIAVADRRNCRTRYHPHFDISTRVTAFTRLFARTKLPSRVTEVLRTMFPPPGMAQLWNFSVRGSKRTTVFGVDPDSLYQITSPIAEMP